MKKSSAFSLLATAILLFSSSISMAGMFSQDPYEDVDLEMTKIQVKKILGTPNDKTLSEGKEEWHYAKQGMEGIKYKIIIFKGNHVISIKNDDVAEERAFELKRAKAGATQVNVGIGIGTNPPAHTAKCVDWNAFGKYAEGGGCNAFGCWPPGGSCNAFGCASTGECSATACEHKIASFHCVEKD